jgi:acetyl esterase/lipase
MVLALLMAIQTAQLEDVPDPAGVITISGHLDSSFSWGMEGSQTLWDPTANPHEMQALFKPSAVVPELTPSSAHPFLPAIDTALHPLASPVLFPDEMFKYSPPMLMLMSDGEFFYKEFSASTNNMADRQCISHGGHS